MTKDYEKEFENKKTPRYWKPWAFLRLYLHDGEAIQLTCNFQAEEEVIRGSIRQSTTISILYSKKIQNVMQQLHIQDKIPSSRQGKSPCEIWFFRKDSNLKKWYLRAGIGK